MLDEMQFEAVEEEDWRLGFRNLFATDNGHWIKRWNWLRQVGIWMLILNGFLAFVLFALPRMEGAEEAMQGSDPISMGLEGFFALSAISLSIGICIKMQGEFFDEIRNGTAEWVLSKPVSRAAFYLSKVLSNVFWLILLLPAFLSAAAFLLLIFAGGVVYLPAFFSGFGLLVLIMLFYFSLTVYLSVSCEKRGTILAISLGSLLGGEILKGILGPLAWFTPFVLPSIVPSLALGVNMPVTIWVSIGVTFLLVILLLFLGFRNFRKLEF